MQFFYYNCYLMENWIRVHWIILLKKYSMNNDYHCDITIIGHTRGIAFISQLENGKSVSCPGNCSIQT